MCIWNFLCYSTSSLPHEKLVFVYYSISLGLLLAYRGAIVLKVAKQTSLSGMVVWLELEGLKNKSDPPRVDVHKVLTGGKYNGGLCVQNHLQFWCYSCCKLAWNLGVLWHCYIAVLGQLDHVHLLRECSARSIKVNKSVLKILHWEACMAFTDYRTCKLFLYFLSCALKFVNNGSLK